MPNPSFIMSCTLAKAGTPEQEHCKTATTKHCLTWLTSPDIRSGHVFCYIVGDQHLLYIFLVCAKLWLQQLQCISHPLQMKCKGKSAKAATPEQEHCKTSTREKFWPCFQSHCWWSAPAYKSFLNLMSMSPNCNEFSIMLTSRLKCTSKRLCSTFFTYYIVLRFFYKRGCFPGH